MCRQSRGQPWGLNVIESTASAWWTRTYGEGPLVFLGLFAGDATMDDESQTFPEKMLFDANLREFATRTNIIYGLEAGGKISQAEAYRRIKSLWKELKHSKQRLRVADEDVDKK